MIYINLSDFKPSDDWLFEVWFLNKKLCEIPSLNEKHEFINENRNVWSKLKKELPFNEKCWYSEAMESVSPYEIEHFRPTKATSRCAVLKFKRLNKNFAEAQRNDWLSSTKYKGQGYWWLAFQYKNFRNSGKLINSTKSTRFPLKYNGYIAHSILDDILKEEPLLLDPTVKGDPDLLTFDPDGKARPSKTDNDEYDHLRAIVSINIYGLNSIEILVRKRETKWALCYNAVIRANNKFENLTRAAIEGDEILYNIYFNEFMDFVDNDIKPSLFENSEFSSVAKACIKSFPAYEWINDYIV